MTTPLRLYAIVSADEASALDTRSAGIRVVTWGSVAAVAGKASPGRRDSRAASRHAGIVGLALETCSSVVPFRFGVELRSEADLRRVLEVNAEALSHWLGRFRDRVEMGLKALLPAGRRGGAAAARSAPVAASIRLPFSLERVRALAPLPEDRRERLAAGPRGPVFEGCYLISRRAIDPFWAALDEIRRLVPDLPLLGSGPWAPYSFCGFVLRPDAEVACAYDPNHRPRSASRDGALALERGPAAWGPEGERP